MSKVQFKVVKLTANGNLLLEPVKHKQPISNKTVLEADGKQVVEVFDTIASVEAPRYLAKPVSNAWQVGMILTKR